MLINQRNALMATGKLSAKDIPLMPDLFYFNGVENSGWGVHDGAAPRWVDLLGNVRLNHPTTPSWTSNALILDGNHNHAPYGTDANLAVAINGNSVTVEVLFMPRAATLRGNNAIFGAGSTNGNTRALWLWNNIRLTYRNSQTTVAGTFADDEIASCAFGAGGVYINGALVSTPTLGTTSNTSGLFNVGRIPGFYSVYGDYSAMLGFCYALRGHSRILSAAEVAANYEFDKAMFNLPDAS